MGERMELIMRWKEQVDKESRKVKKVKNSQKETEKDVGT